MKNIFNLLFVMLIAMNFHSCDDWNIKKVITPSHSDGSEAGHRKGQPRYTTV